MEIREIEPFLEYWDKVRGRTLRVARRTPPERLEWSFREGRWTIGDLLRHLGAIERYMFAENVQGRPSRYPGCGRDLADGYDEAFAFLERTHAEAMAIFAGLSPDDLQSRCETPGGAAVPISKWLRSMVEHECHHRGQLYLYLAQLDIPTPPLYGLTSEEVLERSVG
jgi:uncharacterized damage-inducible protein DinB